MCKDILTFADIEIEKNQFYHHKTPILFRDVDIEKMLISNKISFGEKKLQVIIGYLYDNHNVSHYI